MIGKKLTGLVYGEGRKDKKFLNSLIELEKFNYHTKKWHQFDSNNSHGCSPQDILENCRRSILGKDYDIVLCFIDLDKLKHDFKEDWESKKIELENKYKNITVIWFLDRLEDEMSKVLGETNMSKNQINRVANQNISQFINSDLWKRILLNIRNKEKELSNT